MFTPELDIVRNNPDLHFPDDVAVRFIGWNHLSGSVQDVVGSVASAQVVCLENARRPMDPEEAERYRVSSLGHFAFLNEVISGTDEVTLARATDLASKGEVATRLALLLKPGTRLVPVDNFDDITVGNHPTPDPAVDLKQSRLGRWNNIVERESLVVRQLHEHAWRLSRSPQAAGGPKFLPTFMVPITQI